MFEISKQGKSNSHRDREKDKMFGKHMFAGPFKRQWDIKRVQQTDFGRFPVCTLSSYESYLQQWFPSWSKSLATFFRQSWGGQSFFQSPLNLDCFQL